MIRFSVACLAFLLMSLPVRAETRTILALGDSLTAGYGLDAPLGFTAKLEEALNAKGLDVKVINAGVSGDTAMQGAARLDWALTDDIDAVIVELGANDMLRGLNPDQAEVALTQILLKLKNRNLPVLLAGMRAAPNLGPDYVAKFDAMYPKLAAEFGVGLYPFFLDGVAAEAKLNQADGIHPTAEGIAVIVTRILPHVEKLLGQVK